MAALSGSPLRLWLLGAGVAVPLVVVVAVVMYSPAQSQSGSPSTHLTGQEVMAVLVDGRAVEDGGDEVTLLRHGAAVTVRPGVVLAAGDLVRTGPRARLVLRLEEGGVELTVLEGTELRVGPVLLNRGRVVARVVGELKDRFEVDSAYAVAGAEGTDFVVTVSPAGSYTCAVLEGVVRVRPRVGSGEPLRLPPRELATADAAGGVTTRRMERWEHNELVELLNRLERTLRESPSRLLVPEVTGLPVDDAMRELRAAGIPEVAVRGPRDGGVVAAQVPRPGNHLSAGAGVELVLAPGPDAAGAVTTVFGRPQRVTTPSVVVPSLVDLEWRQAKEVLRRAGLPVRGKARVAEWGDDWVVIGQTPAAGELVAPGSSVELRFVLPDG